MNQKISLGIILLFAIFNVNSMFFTQEEQEQRLNLVIINAMEKALTKPIVLQPTNKDVQNAQHFVTQAYNFKPFGSKTLPLCLETLIGSNNDDPKNVSAVNSIMTTLLFEPNDSGDDKPATAKIDKNYLKRFPELISQLRIAEPKNLVLKSAWQILSTMPSLYDTFCAAGWIKNNNNYSFKIDEFKKSSPEGLRCLADYTETMAKVALSDDTRKNILITRLVQKLGDSVQFLDYMRDHFTEIPSIHYRLKALEKTADNQNNVNQTDARLEASINLVLQTIKDTKTEILQKLLTNLNKVDNESKK